MVEIPKVRDCMSTWLVTLNPETDIVEAIDLLVAKRASGAPVVDRDGTFVGVLTEKDCIRVLSNRAYGEEFVGKVKDYMSTVKAVITSDMDLFRAAEVFLERNFPVLPVMEESRLVGRMSRQDMLRAIQELIRKTQRARTRAEEDLRIKQHPSSIDDMQKVFADTKPEHLAALLSNRHQKK